jgi:hypothetical protein
MIKKYINRFDLEQDILKMEKRGWHITKISKLSSNSKILGCSGCCILPIPLFWYKKFQIHMKLSIIITMKINLKMIILSIK